MARHLPAHSFALSVLSFITAVYFLFIRAVRDLPDAIAMGAVGMIFLAVALRVRRSARAAQKSQPDFGVDNFIQSAEGDTRFAKSTTVQTCDTGDYKDWVRDRREALKEMIRSEGMAKYYICQDCGAAVSGQHLVRHFDNVHPWGSFRAV